MVYGMVYGMVIGMAWYMVWFMAWIMAWHGLHVVVLHSCEHDHDMNHSPPFSQALTAALHVIVSIWMLLRAMTPKTSSARGRYNLSCYLSEDPIVS